MYQYCCKIANRVEPRSGATYMHVGLDLGSRLFASSTMSLFINIAKVWRVYNCCRQLFHFVSQHTIGYWNRSESHRGVTYLIAKFRVLEIYNSNKNKQNVLVLSCYLFQKCFTRIKVCDTRNRRVFWPRDKYREVCANMS